MFWLAQGSVQIDGTLDLDGANGETTSAVAGSGGYFGGAARQPGYKPGNFKSNAFLVPLVGGSGGDGGETGGGGAGGGALLIASSTGITVNGAITANGGASVDGVGGNGGSIRLVAPAISGTGGVISAKGGQPQGADGLVRFETIRNEFSGGLNETPSAQGKPFGLFLPPNPPGSVRVVSIGGVPVGAHDSTIDESSPVVVVIEARFIPPGTVVRLDLFSDLGISQTFATAPLEGTFQMSRAMALITFPRGSSRNNLRASWTDAPRTEQRK